jgi:fatty-acid peroxygenase
MAAIPRDPTFDASLAFAREGYRFIPNRCRRLGSDAFETRIGLKRAVCMQGAEAAALVYSDRFTRRQAVPRPMLALLQDIGSVAGLDGAAHRHRKQMFLSLMAPDAVARLVALTEAEARRATTRWERAGEVVLLEAVEAVLCRAVSAWSGVPLSVEEAPRRAADLSAMIDGSGSLGPRYALGHVARRRTERWLARIVRGMRDGALAAPADSAAAVIVRHRELDRRPLDDRVAVVELLNVLRPTVAVARFVMWAALALHRHPAARELVASGGEDERRWFVQEVRRFYPFFPAVAARAREEFEWRGRGFSVRQWVLLGLFGTNHDERIWGDPGVFRPERFRDWDGDPFTLIPQGAGLHAETHRCPGEEITIALLALWTRMLTNELRYVVPEQDLRVDLARVPAQPASRFVIRNVRLA